MLTLAVFSCNRLHYLRNCIDSLARYVDLSGVDVLVVDNASSEPGMDEYLNVLPNSCSRSYVKRFEQRSPAELYRAMRFAVEWSRDRGNKFIHFIQDDCQFLRSDPFLIPQVFRTFNDHPEVAQIHVSLIWKAKFAKWQQQGGTSVVHAADSNWLLLNDKPPCDTGITRVSLFDQIGFWPDTVSLKGEAGALQGEEWMYEQCRRIDAKRMYSLRPVLGMLFDAAYVRGEERIGRYVPPPDGLYVRPLEPDQIDRIKSNELQGRPSFIEDFQHPSGWKPESQAIRSEQGRQRVAEAA